MDKTVTNGTLSIIHTHVHVHACVYTYTSVRACVRSCIFFYLHFLSLLQKKELVIHNVHIIPSYLKGVFSLCLDLFIRKSTPTRVIRH